MGEIFLNSFSAEGILIKAASLATEPLTLAWGFQEKLKSLCQSLSIIQDITMCAADLSQDRRDAVRVWAEKLKDATHDADDVLDEIKYEVVRYKKEIQNHIKKKVLNFFSLSNPFVFRLKMTLKIKTVNASLVDLKNEASVIGLASGNIDATQRGMTSNRETDSFLDKDEIIVGRDEDVSNIVMNLTSSKLNQVNLSVMVIVGMPGLGKTTVAKAVYNESQINNHFHKKIWMCASNTFSVDSILSRILEFVNNKIVEIQSQEDLLQSLQELLTEKRCLLVLDDVWNEDAEEWRNLMRFFSCINFTRGITIIVTTRSAKVAAIIGTLPHYNLGILSDDDCWSILEEKVFPNSSAPPHLGRIGREIAKKCAGVPLVAKVLGGMLLSKKSAHEWSSISERRLLDMPEGEEKIFSALKLSFDNLKSPFLKQCFTYCSMFKKDSEIERDDLIQLWTAQGLLHPSPEKRGLEMEDIGNEYFKILLQSSLFQEVSRDDLGIVAKCKLNSLVHDFAALVSRSESLTWDFPEMDGKLSIRHAAHIPASVFQRSPERSFRGLRSLFSNGEVPSDMLQRFRALHVLNLCEAGIKELPNSIGKLKQLGYFNISGTEIEVLPESIGKLRNLQTLRMQNCRKLKLFPRQVQDLVNLRHIYFDYIQKKRHFTFGWCRQFPVRIGQLTNLRTIPYFSVGLKDIGFGIEELNGLNQLKGELTLYDLEHVRDEKEAKKANLVGKRNITKLTLVWGEDRRPKKNEENVLEDLQPHPDLKILEIHNFKGAKFPLWTFLTNLEKVRLLRCDTCEEVPVLGHLPNLLHLELDMMSNLKILGAISSSEKSTGFFPVLKTLKICTAPNLIEWIEASAMSTETVVVFPCLEELTLSECPQLKNVPNHLPCLRQLEISACHKLSSLSSLLKSCASLQNLEISNCDSLTSISMHGLTSLEKYVIQLCHGLTSMVIQDCAELSSLAGGLEFVRELKIYNCTKLTCISLDSLTSVRKLVISNCGPYLSISTSALQELSSCGDGKYKSISLEELELVGCPELEEFTLHGCTTLRSLCVENCQNLRHFFVDGLQRGGLEVYTSLEKLSLKWCPSLESFPTLHGCTSLCELNITNYDGLISIEQSGLESCTSLRSLRVEGCQNLRHLADGQEKLPLLEEMVISSCSNLEFVFVPSLRSLVIEGCENVSSLLSGIGYCTSIQKMDIRGCPNLTSIPIPVAHLEFVSKNCELSTLHGGYLEFHSSIEELRIVGCPKLMCISIPKMTSLWKLFIESCGSKLLITSTLDELSLQDCPALRSLSIIDCQNFRLFSGEGLEAVSLLEELNIRGCPQLKLIPITQGIACLRKLNIVGCRILSSLTSVLEHCSSLSSVHVQSCRDLRQLAVGLGTLSLLQELTLSNCPNLHCVSIACLQILVIEGCENLSSLLGGLGHCTSIQKLKIRDYPSLTSIPILGVFPRSLVELVIEDCAELLSLLGGLEYVEELIINNCPKLACIDLIDSQTSLRKLIISSCGPELFISSSSTTLELSLHGCTSLRSLCIDDCQNLRELSGDWLQTPISLVELKIVGCLSLEAIHSLDKLTSLCTLEIQRCDQLASLPSGLPSCTSLTHLSIWSCHNLISLADEDFSGLQSLSFLTIQKCGKLQYLPMGLNSLTHLDCMTIGDFWNELDTFPDFEVPSQVKELVLVGWPKLKSLPQQIQKLTSLTSLRIYSFDGVEVLPEWLGNLTSLSTELGIEHFQNLMRLPTVESMQRLTMLQALYIYGCPFLNEVVTKDSIREFPKVSDFPPILPPSVHDFVSEDCVEMASLSGGVFEFHGSIQELRIANCPNLIGISIPSLAALQKLFISSCGSELFISSPTIDELSFHSCTTLRSLSIEDCQDLRRSLVYGLETLSLLEELNIRDCPYLDFFPITQSTACLRKLVIEACENLSSLPSVLKHCNSLEMLRISGCPNLASLPISHVLPRSLIKLVIEDCAELLSLLGGLEYVQELSIGNCPKLECIGSIDSPTLRKLVIASCGPKLLVTTNSTTLELSLQGCTSLRSLCIEYCQNLRELSGDWLQTPISLEELRVVDCSSLEAIPSLDNLTSLRTLEIQRCDQLSSLPSGLPSCTSLTHLSIWSCHNLTSLADEDLSSLQLLSCLTILSCGKLEYLPKGLQSLAHLERMTIGDFSNKLDSFPANFDVPSQIKELVLLGWPMLKSLPQQIQHSASLTSLRIHSFNRLEALPDWLGNLTSLGAELGIEQCENLTHLPSKEYMQRLTKLQTLYIYGCRFLNQNCAKGSGREWPKISHIPRIEVDGRTIN